MRKTFEGIGAVLIGLAAVAMLVWFFGATENGGFSLFPVFLLVFLGGVALLASRLQRRK